MMQARGMDDHSPHTPPPCPPALAASPLAHGKRPRSGDDLSDAVALQDVGFIFTDRDRVVVGQKPYAECPAWARCSYDWVVEFLERVPPFWRRAAAERGLLTDSRGGVLLPLADVFGRWGPSIFGAQLRAQSLNPSDVEDLARLARPLPDRAHPPGHLLKHDTARFLRANGAHMYRKVRKHAVPLLVREFSPTLEELEIQDSKAAPPTGGHCPRVWITVPLKRKKAL